MADKERVAEWLKEYCPKHNTTSSGHGILPEVSWARYEDDASDLLNLIKELGYRLPPACQSSRGTADRPKLELIGGVGNEITYAVDKGRTGEIRTTKLTRRDIRTASFQLAADRKAQGVK